MTRELTTVLDGCTYLEAPRWRDDRIWVSDMYKNQVVSANEDGSDVRVEATLNCPPAGIDWLPDGRLLISASEEKRILRREADGSLVTYADLSSYVRGWVNEIVVDAGGYAYVGHFGFDIFAGEAVTSGSLLTIAPDGTVTEVADDLWFPNGSMITPDGVLLVGESLGNRITAFDLGSDGSVTNRRAWATFGELPVETDIMKRIGELVVAPDGATLDAEGAVWTASFVHGRVVRVREGGEIVDEIIPGTGVFACMLGGADGRTLFLCTAPDFDRQARTAEREGKLVAVRVDVPHAGRP